MSVSPFPRIGPSLARVAMLGRGGEETVSREKDDAVPSVVSNY